MCHLACAPTLAVLYHPTYRRYWTARLADREVAMMVVVLAATLMQGDRVTFDCEEGAFSVVFRSRPSCEYFDSSMVDALLERASGGLLKSPDRPMAHRRRSYTFSDSDFTGTYVVTVTCPPPRGSDVLTVKGHIYATGSRVLSTTRMAIGKYQGTRSVITHPTGVMYETSVVGDHGADYRVIAAPTSARHTFEAMLFLGSFRILPSTEKAWCRNSSADAERGGGAAGSPRADDQVRTPARPPLTARPSR